MEQKNSNGSNNSATKGNNNGSAAKSNGINGFVPKNFLFVTIDALATDIAWQIKKEGHNVKFYTENPEDKEVGNGFIDKVDSWENEVEWADVIVFDDVLGQGEKAKKLRSAGKAVVGGTPYTDKLEDDRAFGQEELKKYGVNTAPYWNFTSFDSAIRFVEGNPGKYVIKPSGEAQNMKGLLFIGEEDDGKDVLQVLNDYKKAWAEKIPNFQLQKRINGVEVAVGAFFDGNEFIYPVNINFEHKKLFPKNLGPSCYSEDTEILSDKGWKRFDELTYSDRVLSFNKDREELVWEYPIKIYWMHYQGEMVSFKNRYIDLLLTPNHRTINILKKNFYKKKIKYRVNEAKELHKSGEFIIPQASFFEGKSPEFFELPEFRDGRGYVHPKKQIPMADWAKFMGWYLSEGSYFKNGARVAQHTKSKHNEDIIACLKKLPFTFCRPKNCFKIHSTQLAGYLRSFGHSHDKYIPDEIKNSSKDIIINFLTEFNKGDGDIHDGQRRYHSSSYRMISDIQEMLLKIGIASTIFTDKRQVTKFPDGKIRKHSKVYSLEERKNNYASIRKNNKKTIDYDGHIGCVNVPSSFVVVRRNGRVAISGNTGEMGTTMFWCGSNKLFNSTLKKFEQKFAEEKFVGYIDINCIVNNYGIYPLEWTSRFGYPTISIQQDSMLSPIGEFFYELANGKKPKLRVKSGFHIGVRIVVPPFPFDDQETFDVKSKDSVIYFKKPVEGVHIEDVKLVNEEWLVTGNSGVVLIVCATGQTMKQAQNIVYFRIRNILIPHMYYRSDIGDRWFEDSDRLNNWGYLRES